MRWRRRVHFVMQLLCIFAVLFDKSHNMFFISCIFDYQTWYLLGLLVTFFLKSRQGYYTCTQKEVVV